MPEFLEDKSEKKVQYLELIYDLIFVYLVSRNGELLHVMEDGFIRPGAFLTYLMSTLAILLIWYESTLFINRYGDGSVRVYLGLFVNMYLLYYMADGIRVNWGAYFYRYNAAWALILLNMALQYFLLLRKKETVAVWERRHCKMHMTILLAEAGIVLASLPVYRFTGIAFSPLAVVFGFAAPLLTRRTDALIPVDFPHLSERVMLYVVFTFGEMILGIAGYFSGGFSLSAVYYSLMAFFIVAGLFTGYGYFYEHLLDREAATTGTGYMLLHVVMILALNNITASMEFMQKTAVSARPKNILLVASLLVYFLCLLLTQRYAVKQVAEKRMYGKVAVCFAVFCVLSALCYRQPQMSIALSVAFIYLQLFALHRGGKDKTP